MVEHSFQNFWSFSRAGVLLQVLYCSLTLAPQVSAITLYAPNSAPPEGKSEFLEIELEGVGQEQQLAGVDSG